MSKYYTTQELIKELDWDLARLIDSTKGTIARCGSLFAEHPELDGEGKLQAFVTKMEKLRAELAATIKHE